MRLSLKVLVAAGTLPLLSSCQSFVESQVFDPPGQDAEYGPALAKHHRSGSVYKAFGHLFSADVVYLSEDFQKAFRSRWERTMGGSEVSLKTGGTDTVFFVSLFTPDRDAADFRDSALWSFKLEGEGLPNLSPMSIKPIAEKSRWSVFFPQVSRWTSEFLITFPKATLLTQPQAKLVESPTGSPYSFTVSGQGGKLLLSWQEK